MYKQIAFISIAIYLCNLAVGIYGGNENFRDVVTKCDRCCNSDIKVEYGRSVMISNGNELTPYEVYYEPSFTYPADSNALYTLIMIDPDAPNPQKADLKEWLHWLVVNIPGDRVRSGNLINTYKGPSPPQDGGLHRYVFLVYKQAENLDAASLQREDFETRRERFNSESFASTYRLGEPLFCNYFTARYQ